MYLSVLLFITGDDIVVNMNIRPSILLPEQQSKNKFSDFLFCLVSRGTKHSPAAASDSIPMTTSLLSVKWLPMPNDMLV